MVCGANGDVVTDGNIGYGTFGEFKGGAEDEVAYTGKQRDSDTGLYYFNARYYDATVGRFVSVDPVKSGNNWYVYAANNPLRYVDPTGLETHIFSLPIIFGHRHLFIAVKSEDGTITTKGLYPESQLDAALQGLQQLVTNNSEDLNAEVRTNDPTELAVAEGYFNEGKVEGNNKHEGEITTPESVSEEAFDTRVLMLFDLYLLITDRDYNALKGPNSNTAADDVIEGAGGTIPDSPGATQQNWGEQNPGDHGMSGYTGYIDSMSYY